MRRLYWQIYLVLIGVFILSMVVVSAIWWMHLSQQSRPSSRQRITEIVRLILPPPEAPREELEQRLKELSVPLDVDLGVWGPDGERLAASSEAMPAPAALESTRGSRGFFRRRGRSERVIELLDGRRVVVSPHEKGPRLGLIGSLLVLACVTGLCTYPVVRRLTRRLEVLKNKVEALGRGDLSVRVPVEGRDEVAALARSFNAAAERVEQLVEQKKNALAVASHELRTPLARIRVALELIDAGERPELPRRIEADIAELDDLIGELLAMSRLDTPEFPIGREEVDLLGLVAEEAAALTIDVDVQGERGTALGDVRLLRRLVRNLLQNAQRHGGECVWATVQRQGDAWWLRISDDGPGVAAEERTRIFEPFYRPPGAYEASSREGGLGLALVRQIAVRHGGDVTCRDRAPQRGTLFEVRLPLPPVATGPDAIDCGGN
jgi:signal transduction histidine kinase